MTDTITLSDGTTSLVYNKWRGIESVNKDTYQIVRKTDERDATPELLIIRQQMTGSFQNGTAMLLTSVEDSVTGKVHNLKVGSFINGDLKHFGLAIVVSQLVRLGALQAISGFREEFAQGKL